MQGDQTFALNSLPPLLCISKRLNKVILLRITNISHVVITQKEKFWQEAKTSEHLSRHWTGDECVWKIQSSPLWAQPLQHIKITKLRINLQADRVTGLSYMFNFGEKIHVAVFWVSLSFSLTESVRWEIRYFTKFKKYKETSKNPSYSELAGVWTTH